jgi:gamma-glutamylcyclotransferase
VPNKRLERTAKRRGRSTAVRWLPRNVVAKRAAAKITCFAYGSNMFSSRMCAPHRVPSAKPLKAGYINAHRLTFDKVSKKDGSGKCDAELTRNDKDRVYGVLYEVDQSEKPKLDEAEGFHQGYEEKTVDVVTVNGVKAAVMYYATSKDSSLKPYHWYKALVVAGAVEHGLPFPYVEWLRTIESVQDQDTTRRLEHERLLSAWQRTERSTRKRATRARSS